MNKITFEYGKHTVTIETGEIAKQATAAVMVKMDDTYVLVTAVGAKTAEVGRDFFPLTVNYQERTYAAGKIPGGYFKREGRPSENEILTSRLIDRPLRPLFPEGFTNEVQVVASVMSLDPEVNPDIPAMIGASAAIALSGMPFAGPMGAARVGYVNKEFILNPTTTQLKESELDMVVAGTTKAVLMVESEADMLPEEVMLDAVMFAHEKMQTVIRAIEELCDQVGRTKWDWQPAEKNQTVIQVVAERAKAEIAEAYKIADKQQRQERLSALKEQVLSEFQAQTEAEGAEFSLDDVSQQLSDIEKQVVRQQVISGSPRIDGRDTRTVRPITVKVGVLPRTHGSALFTRGETQAIVVATMGTDRDSQIIDDLLGERRESFMLHYNFPPYCTGELGMVGSPKRREIGHGRLAKRAIQAVLPSSEDFPYTLRVVSEITESNGSSSMASVCGATLSLMDAGVPIKAPVAGIAMGLVKEGNRFAILTDILGDEDHLGDMDFKVAGTRDGVTALQMDIKIEGITKEIMEVALEQAKEGRLHILGIMSQTIDKPRSELSAYAPQLVTLQIPQDKIRDVIGKGGVTIRAIIEETGANVDIDDSGIVKISGNDSESVAAAEEKIRLITADVEVGKVYEGKVVKIAEFGAFVNILPGKDGLVHVSEISNERVKNVTDVLSEGQMVRVKVLEMDRQGRIRLSMKALLAENA